MAQDAHVSRFPPEPTSVASARRFAGEIAASLHPQLRDPVKLMVSELATNAVRHGRSEYAVEVRAMATGIRVEVSDQGEGWPLQAAGATSETGGRGLRIVEGLADAWGVLPGGGGRGKTVWFEVHAGATPGG